MNTQLVFKKKSFLDVPVNYGEAPSPIFSGDVIGTAEDKTNYILNLANNCRGWYEPVFTNESKYLPVSDTSIVILEQSAPQDNTALALAPDGSFADVSGLTTPPQKREFTELEKGLLIAGAAFIIIKLLS